MKLPSAMYEKVGKDGKTHFYARPMVNGRRVFKSFGTNRRRAIRAFEKWLAELRDAADGIPVQPSTSLRTLLSEFLRFLNIQKRSDSHRQKVKVETERLLDWLGVDRVTGLHVSALERFQEFRQLEGSSNRTINLITGYLQSVLNHAVKQNRIVRNPIKSLEKLPEGGRHRRRVRRRLQRKDCPKLLAAAEEMRIGLLVDVILGTGFRLGEALRLCWDDHGSRTLTARNTKNNQDRTNPISARLDARLREVRKRQGGELGRLPQGDDLIIQYPRSQSWAVKQLYLAVEAAELKVRNTAGEYLDFHALRHTYCTLLIEAGAPPQAVQGLMGHKSIQVTMRVYADLDRVPKQSAIDLLGDVCVAREDDGDDGETGAAEAGSVT